MSEISNKKKKFIKKNSKKFSIEELARQSGLNPAPIKSLIDKFSTEVEESNRDVSKRLSSSEVLPSRQSLKLIGVGIIVIFVITFMLYTPALKNDFVNWDDNIYVYENPHIRSLNFGSFYRMFTEFHAGLWLPLTWLSHALDYAIWGLEPLGHHLTSIVLHALNTVLLFLFFIQLVLKTQESRQKPSTSQLSLLRLKLILISAGVTALLFGVHPLRVESVVWACERKDILCAFFYLLSLLCYVSYVSASLQGKRWRYGAVLFLFLLALLSKPMAVSLPVILLLLDFYPLNRFMSAPVKNLWVLWEKIPFFILSIITSIVTIMAQSEEATTSLKYLPLDARMLTALRSLVFYLQKLIIPFNLVPFYPYPLTIYLFDAAYITAGIVVLVITGGCLWMVQKKKYLFIVVWTYYVVTLLPVIGIVQVGKQAAADRFTYLPSLSIFILVGVGVFLVFEKIALTKRKVLGRTLFLTLIGTVLILLGQSTTKQIRVWQNSEILWSYVIYVFPEKIPLAYNNLGHAYYEQGRVNEAIEEYRKALAVNPDHQLARFNLGFAYAKQGRLDEAIAEYERVLITTPGYFDAHYNLGHTYYEKGRVNEAIEEYRKALAVDPGHLLTYNNLGILYENQGKLEEAISTYRKALTINSNSAEVYNRIGKIYAKRGLLDEAITDYKKAIALNPNDAKMYCNLGAAYIRKKMFDEAISQCSKAISLNPMYAKAYYNLGSAYANKGMLDEALSSFKKAITINPKYTKAHYNLALVFYLEGNYRLSIESLDRAIELGQTVNPELLEALNPHR